MDERQAPGPVGAYRVKQDRPEPPGWRERDETMEAVYARNAYIPLLFFMVWYGCVQLGRQLYRLAWIANWEARRRLRPDRPILRVEHGEAAAPDAGDIDGREPPEPTPDDTEPASTAFADQAPASPDADEYGPAVNLDRILALASRKGASHARPRPRRRRGGPPSAPAMATSGPRPRGGQDGAAAPIPPAPKPGDPAD